MLDGIEEPVFGDETVPRGKLTWDDVKEVPPELVARMRLVSN